MKFRVKSPLSHDNKDYPVGSTVELTDEQAANVGDAVEPIKVGKKGADAADAADGSGAESKKD